MNFKYLICISLIAFSISFKCGFDQKKKPKPQIHPKENTHRNPNYRNLDASSIRIYVDYEVLEKSIESSVLDKFKEAFNLAITAFGQYLTVKKTDTYSFTKDIIDGYKADFSGSDVPKLIANSLDWEGDIFLVPVIDSSLDEGVDAAAYPLALDKNTNRPILGCVCLGTHYNFSQGNYIRFLGMLLLHEISHVLAFNEQLYEYFVDVTNPTVKELVNGANRTLLATPKVLEYARNHFGCQSLTGVELENQGGEGSEGSHWEARIMLGDYMISTDYPELVVSDITLAVFEDSGWYGVNYYTGGLFKTGKGEGCNFLQRKCISGEKTSFPLDFCDNTDDEVCSPGLLDRGSCYIAEYKSVPSIYQYFTDTSRGGYVPADYCPASVPSTITSGDHLISRCDQNGDNSFHQDLTENLTSTSFCFQSSLLSKSASSSLKSTYGNKLTARCYSVENCDDSTLSYDIIIENQPFPCESATKTETYSNITGMDGDIVCPPYWRVCGGTVLCNDPFVCAEKNSQTRLLNSTQYVTNTSAYEPELYSDTTIKPPVAASSGYVKIYISFFLFLYFLIF